MFIIGISGLIGTGKSTVCSYLVEMGADLIDADSIGHSAYKDIEIYNEIVSIFGHQILDKNQKVNREKLSDIVFNDFDSLEKLNSIVHPYIKKIILNKMNHFRNKGSKVVVLEAAILLQAGWRDLVDEVWTVTTLKDIVLDRINSRLGMDANFYELVLRSQNRYSIKQPEKYVNSEVILLNNDSKKTLRKEVSLLWQTRVLKSR